MRGGLPCPDSEYGIQQKHSLACPALKIRTARHTYAEVCLYFLEYVLQRRRGGDAVRHGERQAHSLSRAVVRVLAQDYDLHLRKGAQVEGSEYEGPGRIDATPFSLLCVQAADQLRKVGLVELGLQGLPPAFFNLNVQHTTNIRKNTYICYVMSNTALFPGSFDPFTAGHLNILRRSLTMFDKVIVAVGVNQDKRGFYSNSVKMDIIRQATAGLQNVQIIEYDGLTVDVCRNLGIRHIVRGVRNMLDFENERAIADANRRLAPEIETIIIPTAQEFAHISSSAVRDILRHHGDTSLFVPDGVTLPPVK